MSIELIQAVRKRASNPKKIHDMARGMSPAPAICAPALPEQIAATEALLGFALPSTYKQVLVEIGNGGFGPGYGLMGVDGGHPDFDHASLAEVYRRAHTPGAGGYLPLLPEKILPVCNWGCGIYSCLDCREDSGPVYCFNPDLHVLGDPNLESSFIDAGGTVIWSYQSKDAPPPRLDEEENGEDEEEDEDEETGPVTLILHKTTFDEWLLAWGKGEKLWDEMENLLAAL
jgi:hypothetical protein